MKLRVIILFCTMCCNALLAQESEPEKKSRKYDYFKSRFKIGYTLGQYTYSMSGPDIYMYRANHGLTMAGGDTSLRILSLDDKFTPLKTFRGICVGMETGQSNLRMEIYFTTRKSTSDIKYKYDNGLGTPIVEYEEKVRIRYNAMTLGIGYKFEKLPQLTLGTCMDLGILRTQKKSNTGEDKWEPWFYSFKLGGDKDVKPTTPVATWGLYLMFDIGPLSFKLNRNFTLLDGDLNSQTYKYVDLPWSSKNFPMANTSLSASIKF